MSCIHRDDISIQIYANVRKGSCTFPLNSIDTWASYTYKPVYWPYPRALTFLNPPYTEASPSTFSSDFMKSTLLLISFISFLTNTVIASTNYSLCFAEIVRNNNNTSSPWFNKLLDHDGVPVPLNDTSRGRSVSYRTCLDACGHGQEHFQWSTFSQEFSAWLLVSFVDAASIFLADIDHEARVWQESGFRLHQLAARHASFRGLLLTLLEDTGEVFGRSGDASVHRVLELVLKRQSRNGEEEPTKELKHGYYGV
ncbi:hypothetical protein WG66_006604 [Moniliophthora roreri]|nr:hypothetical protein WG66_006604 [Moniliophthora roreri]